jgi:cell division protein FtsN
MSNPTNASVLEAPLPPNLAVCADCSGIGRLLRTEPEPKPTKPSVLNSPGIPEQSADKELPQMHLGKSARSAKPPMPVLASGDSENEPKKKRHFFVNVGLFTKEVNAQAAYARLTEAGLPAKVLEVTTANRKRFQLKAGPFEAIAQADEAAVKIRLLDLEAIVSPVKE